MGLVKFIEKRARSPYFRFQPSYMMGGGNRGISSLAGLGMMGGAGGMLQRFQNEMMRRQMMQQAPMQQSPMQQAPMQQSPMQQDFMGMYQRALSPQQQAMSQQALSPEAQRMAMQAAQARFAGPQMPQLTLFDVPQPTPRQPILYRDPMDAQQMPMAQPPMMPQAQPPMMPEQERPMSYAQRRRMNAMRGRGLRRAGDGGLGSISNRGRGRKYFR